MLFLCRAASIAVMSLALAGLGSIASPGRATTSTSFRPLAATVIPTQPLDRGQNVPILEPVPTPVPAVIPLQPMPSPAIEQVQPDAAAAPLYATLAAAVAAQAMPDNASDEQRCLAVTVYHEAKGEPLAGQLAVANVVINRSTSGRFPKSVCSVVTQPGQFSFVRNGRLPEIDMGRAAYRTALAVAQVALNASWESPASGALYFHARSRAPGWSRVRIASIGNQIFYR